MFSFSIPQDVFAVIAPGAAPDDALEGSENAKRIKSAVRKMLLAAIEDSPQFDKPAKTNHYFRIRLPLPAKETRIIKKLAASLGVNDAGACETLLDYAIRKGLLTEVAPVSRDTVLSRYAKALKFKNRAEQALFFSCISNMGGLQFHIVDASTGVGKSRGVMAAAAEWVTERGSSAVISVPTKSLIAQYRNLHEAIAAKADIPSLQVIVGRQNFVAIDRVRMALQDELNTDFEGYEEEVSAWLGRLDGEPAYTDDLKDITPIADAYQLTSTDKDDPSEQAYQGQFSGDGGPLIMLTTHAMLASHVLRVKIEQGQREGLRELKADYRDVIAQIFVEMGMYPKGSQERKDLADEISRYKMEAASETLSLAGDGIGMLPPFKALFIDEAHDLDEAMAMIFNNAVSLSSCYAKLRSLAGRGLATAASVKRAKAVLEQVRDLHALQETLRGDRITLNNATPAGHSALLLAKEFGEACSQGLKRGANTDPEGIILQRECSVLKNVEKSTTKYQREGFLKFSPTRKYPTVWVRKRTLEDEFTLLWQMVDKVALVSATIFTRQIGGESSQHLRNKLFVPKQLYVDHPPIKPAWIASPVKQCVVPSATRTDLVPPSRRDRLTADQYKAAESRFCTAAAKEIDIMAGSADGGTLVLCTSYTSVMALEEELAGKHRIIAASRGQSVSKQKKAFIESAAAGRKPIWLGLGAAWTGLDINGDEVGLAAENDNLLVDLVILKVPFSNLEGTDISPGAAALEAGFRFKQGLGRLVRREGLPKNRRIMVLDGRLTDRSMAAYTYPIMQLLTVYPMTEI